MKSRAEGTKVLGFTRANRHVRRLVSGNSKEIVWFFGASTFIGTFVERGLTPVQSKGSANRPWIPDFTDRGAPDSGAPHVYQVVLKV